jgi:hypothetical protein
MKRPKKRQALVGALVCKCSDSQGCCHQIHSETLVRTQNFRHCTHNRVALPAINGNGHTDRVMQVQRESAICNAQEVKRLVGVIHVQVIAHTCAGEAPGTTSILVCVCVCVCGWVWTGACQQHTHEPTQHKASWYGDNMIRVCSALKCSVV